VVVLDIVVEDNVTVVELMVGARQGRVVPQTYCVVRVM
jgi:hypothetical protein